jgi:hypothetical protein
LSTAESEYYGIVKCAKKWLWLKNIFNELGINNKEMIINSDNQNAYHVINILTDNMNIVKWENLYCLMNYKTTLFIYNCENYTVNQNA